MARGPRLDAPGTLHHVMIRGIEKRVIFEDSRDREDFLRRLGIVVEEGRGAMFSMGVDSKSRPFRSSNRSGWHRADDAPVADRVCRQL